LKVVSPNERANSRAAWLPLLERIKPGFACDVGAGSGREVNWLASEGWDVIAVAPKPHVIATEGAESHPSVTWLDDSLPDLKRLRALGHRFDLVRIGDEWMHLLPTVRERAFRLISELIKPGGHLIITLCRAINEDKSLDHDLYPVSVEELLQFARRRALVLSLQDQRFDPARTNVEWFTLAFTIPDDGTGGLPLLRHIIVNDEKSSSYKLGLLRVLTRIAEGAPGVVFNRTDDYVDIPLGLVGLYWLKQYLPLIVQHQIPHLPSRNSGYGFAREAFYRLAELSQHDLRIGAPWSQGNVSILTDAIRDACSNIKRMPVRYIKWPGRQGQSVFEVELRTVRSRAAATCISPDYLRQFGVFRLPATVWQTLGQYACWIEPAIIREWISLTDSWAVRDGARTDPELFRWPEHRRDTAIPRQRLDSVRQAGETVHCVWSNRVPKQPHIDHCFPWARWMNNDLWNLLPTSADVNLSKGDKLPTADALHDASERIQNWWQRAYIDSDLRSRFLLEAQVSLPLIEDSPALESIYQGILHQRARLKADQQLAEWNWISPSRR